MIRKLNKLLISSLLALLLAATFLAGAVSREGWNEPAGAAGHDRNGLLKINADYFNLAAASASSPGPSGWTR